MKISPQKFTQLCKDLEHFETPAWAAREILKHEILTPSVVDPCTGSGLLCKTAIDAGYKKPIAIDVHEWGYPLAMKIDFLSIGDNWLLPSTCDFGFSVFMNPPFSLAEKFVEKSLELGARKIVCFQRFAWWESARRRDWWADHLPNRIYICGNRATCFRHDLTPAERKEMGGTPTAHAWFVWEQGQPAGPIIDRIYKPENS